MKVADFLALKAAQQEALVAPYMMCWQEMIHGAGINKFVSQIPGERIDFVYSQPDDFKSKMQSLWNFSKGYRDYGDFLGRLSFADMRSVAGLQAADLLVYELRHLYHLRDTRPDLGPRLPYRVLMAHQDAVGAQRLKYLPRWLIVAQANGVIEPMMDMITVDMDTYGAMHAQQYPPLINPLRDLPMIRVWEKWDLLSFPEWERFDDYLHPRPRLAGHTGIQSRRFLS